jgi:hypothetical protein
VPSLKFFLALPELNVAAFGFENTRTEGMLFTYLSAQRIEVAD